MSSIIYGTGIREEDQQKTDRGLIDWHTKPVLCLLVRSPEPKTFKTLRLQLDELL